MMSRVFDPLARGCVHALTAGVQDHRGNGAATTETQRPDLPLCQNQCNKMIDILRLATGADTRTLSTLSELSANDIENIWADVSAYIESQMALLKGVHVDGLGTFTFSQQKLDLGLQSTTIYRPIFILSGKLVHSLGLKQARPLAVATHLPVVPLNFTTLAKETAFSRDHVASCIREVLLLLVRTLASQQNVLLPFGGIGVLSFKNNKVQMKFSKEYINAMDATGNLHLAFKKRPGSSASLTSVGSKFQKTQTVNFRTLPTVHSPEPDAQPSDHDGPPEQSDDPDISQQLEQKSHWTPQPAKTREVDPALSVERHNHRPLTSPAETLPKMSTPRVNCSGHTRAGQELCYVCMQRAHRNVPVFVSEQHEAEERSQEQELLLRALHQDRLFYEREQAKLADQREYARGVASFNLRMLAKRDRASSPQCPSSFIFPSRPVTPAPKFKQHQYMNELQTQIKQKQQHETEKKLHCVKSECLEQAKLLQELASVKAQQLKQKQEMTARYKKALDFQVGDKKGTGFPVCLPDYFHFTRGENPDSIIESRKQAKELFQANFSTAAQRKHNRLQEHQAQVEKEREILKQNRIGLIQDRVNHFEKKQDLSRSLLNDWSQSVKLKQQREEEERCFLRSAGQLLVDKLVEYRRCAQCKRRTSNCGQSNIWRDSHYLSGSQFII
ncbi:coiled-coil domain-containing protein 81 [Boleophthalmus pectinirostris]|uniref:coiled-coil domain-containing protein 81 n=1 Tax=Boleophthalmus pectinirostris TaxID=150288 RepID=UPI00242E6451|nr:coiled-coil domain-containing protein 81 [Boleophthalmus pectinirostris]